MGILRFLLAFLVVITHYSGNLFGIKLMPGYVCVEMFFVISGYYMCFILSENKYLKVRKFYASRFFRLYPLFLFISLLLLLKIFLFETITGKEVMTGLTFPYSPLWLKVVSVFSNLSMFGQDLFSLFHINAQHQIQFFHSNDLSGSDQLGYSWGGELRWNGPAWSIGGEIWFYLLVPFIFKLTNRWLLFIVILSLLLKLYLEIKVDYSTYFFSQRKFIYL